jgi:RNA polymerase sigma factor (sigma-70 family)
VRVGQRLDARLDAPQISPRLAERLYRAAAASRWRVSLARFTAALEASAAKAFQDAVPVSSELEAYLHRLHLADLALACACADGDDAAWEHFVLEHRPALYRAAAAMAADGGRELADSLYGDLFGTSETAAERRSLFRYFHGRSSLSTWLRAVLAQRHVDRIRATRRLDPLPDEDSPAALPHPSTHPDPERGRWLEAMRRAMTAAIAALEPRDRLRLACYYGQDLTLAQIGRSLGEHEATVSRHLTRCRRELRDGVERYLREREGLNAEAVAECLASVLQDAGSLDVAELMGATADRKKPDSDRSP